MNGAVKVKVAVVAIHWAAELTNNRAGRPLVTLSAILGWSAAVAWAALLPLVVLFTDQFYTQALRVAPNKPKKLEQSLLML